MSGTNDATNINPVDSQETVVDILPEAQEQKEIYIKANAKSNGITSLAIGLGVFLSGFILLPILPKTFAIGGFVLVTLGIIGTLIGYYKIKEPPYSLKIDEAGIAYYQRKGQWFIPWDNIQRIDQPRISKGLEQRDLEMVGIRIKHYDLMLNNISRRLMTGILMEQRPLLAFSAGTNCATGMCGGSDMTDETRFKMPDGSLVLGVQAMFSHRMNKLRGGLGYDLYINESELDRPVGDFVALLRACKEDVIYSQLERERLNNSD